MDEICVIMLTKRAKMLLGLVSIAILSIQTFHSVLAQTPAVPLPIQKEGQRPSSVITTDDFSDLNHSVLSESSSDSSKEEIPEISVRADNATDSEHHEPHGAELLGVLPGKTLMTDLESNSIWSKPISKEVIAGYLVQTFQLPDLPEMPYIQILGRNNVVEGIVVHLLEPREEQDARLAFDEAIKNVRSITIADGNGAFREIFPEKGLVFVLAPSDNPAIPSTRVVQIIAETVKPEYYVIRAESDLKKSLTDAKHDVEHALLHEPNYSPAFWILAKISLITENFKEAKQFCVKAIKLDDSIPQYHLTLVEILIKLEQWDNAARYLEAIQSYCQENPLFLGQWSLLKGTVLREAETLNNPDPNYNEAIAEHEKALEKAKSLNSDLSAEIQLAAKLLELNANLALVLDLARRESEKGDYLPVAQKIAEASLIADELYQKRKQSIEPLFDVCRTAISVGLDFPDTKEIDKFVQNFDKISQTIVEETKDSLARETFQWKAAQTYIEALRIYEAQENSQKAIACGTKAIELLEAVLVQRSEKDQTVMGQVFYLLGNVKLNLDNDTKSAIQWFDKANAVFENLEDSFLDDSGEIAIIMLNSSQFYWKNNQKEKALTIAQNATKLIERSVQNGLADSSELFVPYSNLAIMLKNMNKPEEAKKYAALAEKNKK